MSKRRPSFLSAALVLAATLIMVPAAVAATWHVDDDNCPGPGDGSTCNPFCRITDAVNAASTCWLFGADRSRPRGAPRPLTGCR